MKNRTWILTLGAAIFVVACAGPGPSSPMVSPSVRPTAGASTTSEATGTPPPMADVTAEPTATEFRHGPQGLLADLTDAGAEAQMGESFDGEPLARVQTLICVDGEGVRVFPYASEQERAAVSAQIDPGDPSNVGTSIVEWDGSPKFWQRDRIIVLYLGKDEGTIGLLTQLMGEPFAQAQGRPQRLRDPC